MKRDYILPLVALGLYSGLFYEQLPGINFLIFTIVLLGLSLIHKPEHRNSITWRLAALGALISAVCIAWHGNALSTIANIISLGLVSILAVNPGASVVTALFIAFCNTVFGWVVSLGEKLFGPGSAQAADEAEEEKTPFRSRLLMFGVPVVLVLIFLGLYSSANPVFDYYLGLINLDFISAKWIIFTLAGIPLVLSFFSRMEWKGVNRLDKEASGTLTPERINPDRFLNKILTAANENTSGIMLFGLLNLLLLIVNAIDINFVMLGRRLPAGITHSQMVHQGVDALIWSIILAVGIILYHFRGRLNFLENNKTLRILACKWIAQNAFIIFSTGVRNYQYISAEGITAKRIGVYVYLLLCTIGLIFTLLKIMKKRTNWQLVRQVSWAFYAALIVSCVMNWEAFITDYNVQWQRRHNKVVNGGYFISLNTAYLKDIMELRNTQPDSLEKGAIWPRLDPQVYNFMRWKAKLDWRSWNGDDEAAWGKLRELSDEGTLRSFRISNEADAHLEPLAPLRIQKLVFDNTVLDSIGELAVLPALKEFDLINGDIRSLAGIEKLQKLEVLDVRGIHWIDFTELAKLKALKLLYVSNLNEEQLKKLRELMPHTDIRQQ